MQPPGSTVLTIGELQPGERFQETVGAKACGGAFFDENGEPDHRIVSAVVTCDWFDTLNRDDPGTRLHCIVLHHFSPDVPLPRGTFGGFPEVDWRETSSHLWEPKWSGASNVVAKFADGRELEFHAYSGDNPW